MKRLAVTLLAVLFLVTQGLLGAPATAQPIPDAPSRLRLDITQLNPRWLSSTSTSLNISGKITNIGDRRISKLIARLQLGERQTTERQFTDSMAGGQSSDTSTSQSKFADVAESLEPGQTAALNVTVPLGNSPGALQLSKPGVYPLLVNVNGTPEFGGVARLAALSVLLPVLSVPGKPQPERPAKATGVSVLWPIADTVPRVSTMPFRGQLVLDNDDLAAELSTGGRLNSLVTAAKLAQSNRELFNSLCFALDPDLIETVNAMTAGYQVRTPDGTENGQGVEAAKQWLGTLRELVSGHCVVAIPYADADLTVLSKVRSGDDQDTDLFATAADGATSLQQVLGVQPNKGVLWPDGALDTKTLALLPGAGVETLLTDARKVKSSAPVNAGVSVNGTTLRAQPLDALVSSALAGTVPVPASAGNGSAAGQPEIAAQNGLAALAFRAGVGQQAPGQQPSPGQLVLAPPRHWNVPLAELNRFLATIGDYTGLGVISPVPLPQLLAAPVKGQATMNYGTQELASGPPAELSDAMSDIDTTTAGLVNGMTVDAASQVKPAELVRPIRTGLMRAASTAWRGANGGTPAATFNAREELDSLREQVTVIPPAQTINLASGTSPLPVLVKNGLPVTMTVRIKLNNSTGLRSKDVQDWVIPANAAANKYISVEALRAGRFSVDVTLSTPSGTQLGSTTRFELTSNDYGAITIIITATAGGALLLLSSRRIYRRIKEGRAQRV